MAQHQLQQDWHSGRRMPWLATLIETMDLISYPEVRAKPCDPSLLRAVEKHLARPLSPAS